MKKWLLLAIIYGLVVYFSFQNREFLLQWIKQSDMTHLPFMFVLASFLAIIPVIPFTFFAGIMGAKYGMFLGGIVNWFGAATAAMFFFFIARYTFAKFFKTYITRYKNLKRFNSMVERNAFTAVLFGRLIPIIPTPVVNIYSGISNMNFRVYMWATIIGQMPSMFIFAYSGDKLFTSVHAFIFGISIYFLFILTVIVIYRFWYKEKTKAV